MENLSEKPYLIEGGIAIDERGQVTFANDFNFKGVKRFYLVENFSTKTIRAFHGHLKEAKYAFVVSGSALVVVVEMDNPQQPNKNNKPYRFVLSSRKSAILYIPPRHANGLRALEEGTKIIFFSTASLEETKKDEYRFPYDYWGKEIWEEENR